MTATLGASLRALAGRRSRDAATLAACRNHSLTTAAVAARADRLSTADTLAGIAAASADVVPGSFAATYRR